MAIRTQPRIRIRRILMPALAAAYLGYFGFHAFHGTYGIFAKAAFESDAVQLTTQLTALQAQTSDLERHVAMLRPESMDPDMIDEQARKQLNVIGTNEVVIVP